MTHLLKKLFSGDPGLSTPQLKTIVEEKFSNDNYINRRFMKAVLHYNHLSERNKQQYTIMQLVLLISSALTPLIVGLDAIVINSNILKLIALILSVFVAILGNYLTTFNIQAKWRSYKLIRETLITEFYKFYKGVDPYSNSIDKTADGILFAKNVEKHIEDANRSWEELHSAGSKSS